MPICVSMYLRTIKRKNKDGSVVEYVQLAHNVRHPEKGYPKAEVIHSFGRREQLDINALKRLVTSIGRFVESDDPPADPAGGACVTFIRSRSVGGDYLLRALWNLLQMRTCIEKVCKGQVGSEPLESSLFALAASCLLTPFSAVRPDALADSPDGLPGQMPALETPHLGHALEVLAGHATAIQKEVLHAVMHRLDLSLDPIFIAIIPACVETGRQGSPWLEDNGRGACQQDGTGGGTMAVAVTREAIPLRLWFTPAARIDDGFIETIKTDLTDWQAGRIVWVMDGHVSGDENQDGKSLLPSRGAGLPPETLAWADQKRLEIQRICGVLNRDLALALPDHLSVRGFQAPLFLLWLMLLLTRMAEKQTGMDWLSLSREMQTLHIGEFGDGNRRIFQHTRPTSLQKKIMRQLGISLPKA